MDKNTIIGFLLIIAVVIGFTMYTNSQQKEEATLQEQQDSISRQQEQQIKTAAKKEAEKSTENSPKTDEKADINNFFTGSANTQTTTPTDSSSVATDSASIPASSTISNATPEEKIVSIENDKLKIDFSTKGGQIVNIQLKGYSDYKGDSLKLFGHNNSMALQLENKSGQKLNTGEAYFTPILGQDGRSLVMRLSYNENKHLDYIYTIAPNSYMIDFDIVAVQMQDILSRESQNTFVLNWKQTLSRKEKSIKNEQRYSSMFYKLEGQDVEEFANNKDKNEEVSNPVKWVAFKDQFFATIIIGDNPFETSVLDTKMLNTEVQKNDLKNFEATLYAPVSLENNNVLKTGYKIFAGPLQYNLLKSFDDGVKDKEKQLDIDKLIPLGWTLFRWINQYFVIPLFSLLNSAGMNIGLVILLLTVIVKLIISPLTFKSFMSSAKMRVLRPQIEELSAKYPKQEQAVEKQQATMALYNKAGVNPMAGCIPMLLQMPILLALFAFFPSAIELRHQSFLWASDLSTYDAIIEWSGNIPIISWAFGNHISLFCLLMTATNIVYTKFNMDATNTGQQQMPGMKWMMYLMPVFFLVVLNEYPAGLSYYYFISTLITILLTLGFRYAINEDKVLAKLEANKQKPKKKSGFMARLEEAQRLQQQQARANAKGTANKKKK
ncbi:MAG: membrane protein insertase YidC [Dysgonomonas sp.]